MNKEHKRQIDFLHSLLLRCDCRHAMELLRRMALARHEGRVLHRAILFAAVIEALAVSVLGSATLLAPDSFRHHPKVVLAAKAVGMAALSSVAGLMAYTYWSRAVSNTLHEECRRNLLRQLRSQAGVPHHPAAALPGDAPE